MTRLRAGLAATLLVAAGAIVFLALPWEATVDTGRQTYSVRDIQLNTYTASLQERVVLDMAASGETLAAWESRRQESGSYGVFARRIDDKGIARGGEIHVNETLVGHQQSPVVALSDGREFLAWNSWGQAGAGTAVIARELKSGERVLSDGPGLHELSSMAALPGGRRLVAWSTPAENGSSRVMARIYDAEGGSTGEEIRVSQGGPVMDRLATLSTFDGGFRLAWAREIPGAGNVGILSRAFDLSGSPLAEERLLALGGIEPSISCAADGNFVLAWMRAGEDAYFSIAQLFDANGESNSEVIRPDESGLAQNGVAASMRKDGSFALAWNRFERDNEESDIQMRLYDPRGASLGESFPATASKEGRQMLAVASAGQRLFYGEDGRLALAWTGESGGSDKSAANLSLLLPEVGIAERASWAFSKLSGRLRPTPAGEKYVIAQPHIPPTFEDPGEPVYEAELTFAGDTFRDEGFRLFANTGWTPPDPHAAVGPEHVIGVVNGGIACYEKDGTFIWQDDISGNAFWGNLGADSFVFDPEAIYDPHSGRFMLMACERGDDGHSYFDFAVSADSNPTNNTTEWHKYRLDVTSWSDNDIDSPNMAVTDDAIYLTADFFGPDKYGILIIDKSSVLAGGVPVMTHYLHSGTQSHGIPVIYDAGLPMYMLEDAENFSSSSLKIYAIQNPLGSPSLVSTTFPVDTYWSPIDVRSLDSSSSIETFESRFWSCVVRGGKLWATHHVCPTSLRNTLAARWYEIDLNGWPASGNAPFVVQSGDVLPNGSGYTSFCSISVNSTGQAAINFTYSSLNDHLDMYRVMRNPGDALGTMQAPVLSKASTSGYTQNRWGDYSSIVVDPVDNRSFWSHGEYAVGSSVWSTWVSSFDPGGGTGVDFPHYAFRVDGVWPNPSQGEARFAFELPSAANVSMDLFDVRGRRVRALDSREFGEGRGHLIWDGRDERGLDLPAGVYLARFNVGGRQVPGGSVTLLR